jgi:nucleoside-diphosphate-sugar epimerase
MNAPLRVLVTGAGGALGSQTASLLAGAGASVYGTYRSGSAGPPPDPEVHALYCDLRNREEVRQAVEAAQRPAIVHTAGLAGTNDLKALVEVNAIALANLLDALGGASVQRLLVIGSGAEYAAPTDRRPIDEGHPLGPSTNYGLSKQFQFEISRRAVRGGVPVIYARPFNLIGSGISCATAVGDLSQRLAGLLRGTGEMLLDVGDLDRWRDYLDVRDAASACARLIEAGEPGGVYNICSGEAVLLSDVVDRLIALSGQPVKLRRIVREESTSRFVIGDSSRLRAIDWAPAHALDESLQAGLDGFLREKA